MDLERTTAVLESLGYADKYQEKFIEHKLDDLTIEGWMKDLKSADKKLSAVIPELDSRADFMKSFLHSYTNGDANNEQNMSPPKFEGIRLKPTASREEIIALAQLEALETYILLINVAEDSLLPYGEFYLDETFFERYARTAEYKILHMFKRRCEIADLNQLENPMQRLRRIIEPTRENLICVNAIRRLQTEKQLDIDVNLKVDKYIAGVKTRMEVLKQQDIIPEMKDFENISQMVVDSVLQEFDSRQPRSALFLEAKERLSQQMEQVFHTLVNKESAMEVNEGEHEVPEQPKKRIMDPQKLQIMLREQKHTKAAASQEEIEAIAMYDMFMEVLEESFDTFSEDHLEKGILELYSMNAETVAIQTTGRTNFSALHHMRQLIESENENLMYPNLLRKLEARDTLEVELEETLKHYKTELNYKLKEGSSDIRYIEKIHDSIKKKYLDEFLMKEPLSRLHKDARQVLVSRIMIESEIFKAEFLASQKKAEMEGNLVVQNAVKSYRETMEDAVKHGSNLELVHQNASHFCMKMVENTLKDHSNEFIEQFLNEVDSNIHFIYDGLRG